MGNVAERLADLQRSGVYRVETARALEDAVALQGFALVRIRGPQLAPGWEACLTPRDDGRVLLFGDCAELARRDPPAWATLVATLAMAAVEHRAAGLRFFAVFLDPDGVLPLDYA